MTPYGIISPLIEDYCEAHTSAETPLLAAINHETHEQVPQPRMLSGQAQGVFLRMLSRLIRPASVLEIGAYTGYSAICLAEALAEGGKLTTIELNTHLEERLRHNFRRAGLEEQIDLRIGSAVDILPTLSGPFDLVFIDADKQRYSLYLDLVADKIRAGGWLLADNVLWSGRVADPSVQDKTTQGIRAFNQKIADDPRFLNCLLPLRDGLMLAQKVG